MGLDNGIIVRHTDETALIQELQRFKSPYWTSYEICYWRKCWNIRSEILSVVESYSEITYDCILSKDEVDKIIDVLQSFNEENWRDNGGSIWEFEDMEDTLKEQVDNLRIVRQLMDKYDLVVEFYDSY